MAVDSRDLTTVEAVKAFRDRESDAEFDGLVQGLVTAASIAILNHPHYGREFAPATPSDEPEARVFSHVGGRLIDLSPFDLREVDSIEVDGVELDASEYALRPQPPSGGVYTWIRLSTRYAADSEREVTVTGQWGFAEIPPDVKQAATLTVSIWLDRDVANFDATFSLDENRLERPQALPSSVLSMLRPYQRPQIKRAGL